MKSNYEAGWFAIDSYVGTRDKDKGVAPKVHQEVYLATRSEMKCIQDSKRLLVYLEQ